MVIIFPCNVPGSRFVTRNLCNPALDVKNATRRGLDNVPKTAAKKRFAAKLRKIRWKIYRDIDLGRGNIVKSLRYYKRQVKKFLKEFSLKLRPEEPSIWKEKVSKTSDDIHAFKRKKKMKVQICDSCLAKNAGSLGASLISLSAAYHFVRANRGALKKGEAEDEYLDVEIDGVEGGSVPLDSREYFFSENVGGRTAATAEHEAEDGATDEDESSAKNEIAVGSSIPSPRVFKPVDWTKCLM